MPHPRAGCAMPYIRAVLMIKLVAVEPICLSSIEAGRMSGNHQSANRIIRSSVRPSHVWLAFDTLQLPFDQDTIQVAVVLVLVPASSSFPPLMDTNPFVSKYILI